MEPNCVLNATEYETIMNEAYVNAGMDPFWANASYVKNEIKNLGNQTGYIDKESLPTLGTVSRNENGYPIGYFFGYKAIGVFQTQEEIDSYISPATGKPIQPNAAPGDTKFEDLTYRCG